MASFVSLRLSGPKALIKNDLFITAKPRESWESVLLKNGINLAPLENFTVTNSSRKMKCALTDKVETFVKSFVVKKKHYLAFLEKRQQPVENDQSHNEWELNGEQGEDDDFQVPIISNVCSLAAAAQPEEINQDDEASGNGTEESNVLLNRAIKKLDSFGNEFLRKIKKEALKRQKEPDWQQIEDEMPCVAELVKGLFEDKDDDN